MQNVTTKEILQMLDYLIANNIKLWCGNLYQEYKAELATRIPSLAILY